jgi:hypothetical protein
LAEARGVGDCGAAAGSWVGDCASYEGGRLIRIV